MRDTPPTPSKTLSRARAIAMKNGIRYAFTGNIQDPAGQTTYCHNCYAPLIGRDGYEITAWHLDAKGDCEQCHTHCNGVFNDSPGTWGSRRMPVAMGAAAAAQ